MWCCCSFVKHYQFCPRGHLNNISINFSYFNSVLAAAFGFACPVGIENRNIASMWTCLIVAIITIFTFIIFFSYRKTSLFFSGLLTHRTIDRPTQRLQVYQALIASSNKNYQEGKQNGALTAFCDWKWKKNCNFLLGKTFAWAPKARTLEKEEKVNLT